MKHTALFLSICLLIACQQVDKPKESNSKNSIMVNSSVAPEASNQTTADSAIQVNQFIVSDRPTSDQLTRIDESCGIIIRTDSMKVDQLKGTTKADEERFYIVADDMVNYQYEAGQFLKKMDQKAVYPKTRYLEFVVANGTVILDTTPEQASGWGYAILYKKGKMPLLVYTIDVPMVYQDYFAN